MPEKPPAFQFYAQRWLSSTQHMSLEAQGAYMRLMAWSWDNGPLSNDEAVRARLVGLTLARFRRVWAEFSAKWLHTDKGLVNIKLEQQRAGQEAYRLKQAEAGRASAAKRQRDGNRKSTTVEPPLQPIEPEGQPEGKSPISDLRSPSPEIKNSSAEPQSVSTPVLTFPTAGAAKSWDLDQEQLDDWQELYPGIEVFSECRKALAWCVANPKKQKTAKGMPAFLVNWLNTATNRPAPSYQPRKKIGPGDPEYYERAWGGRND